MTAFSFQLYSAREFPPLEGTLKKLANAGYAQVEGYGPLYEDAAATRAAIDAAGLTMPSGHFALELLEDNEERVVEIAKMLGMKAIFCPYLLPAERPSDSAGWAAFAKRLEALHTRYAAHGYDFGWHNHDFEFVPLPNGKVPMEIIFDQAPSVSWEADIAWIVRGGADPLDWIKRYGARITAVHVKDIAPSGENADEDGWADVGHGIMDWKGLMEALKGTKASLFVIEHDKPSDCDRFASRSITATKDW